MKRIELVALVGLWTTVIWIGIDMYLPAVPFMDEALGTSEQMVNATISMFAIGLPIGSLVGGSLSDKMGMRGFEIGFGLLGCAYLVGALAMGSAFLFTFKHDRIKE